jgi:hypothetical protein
VVSHARSFTPAFDWLTLSLLTMFANLAIRAWRWQYLLEPLGATSFGNAFARRPWVSRPRVFCRLVRARSFALTFCRVMNA